VELALERYGILAALRARGFSDLKLQIRPDDPAQQELLIDGEKGGARHRLIEAVVRRKHVEPSGGLTHPPLELLSLEWLLLQDPTEPFSLRRPRMPGQSHPGLGMLREVVELLRQLCLRIELDGVVFHPSHYHVAALGAGHGRFLDPVVQGRFDAMRAALSGLDFASASSLLESAQVGLEDGTPISWQPADFAAPVSPRLHAYLESAGYEAARQAARDTRLAVRTSK
jgi:hypothetical protein